MKKLITIACCFVFVTAALAGCRRNEDNNRNDTTNPSTITTTHSTAPTTEATQPSTIPDSGFMPDNDSNSDTGIGNNDAGNSNNGDMGMGGNTDDSTPRGRTHSPSVQSRNR